MMIDFLKTAVHLKKIQRQGWIDKLSMSNPESVADHSFSMAIIGMMVSDLENYNSERILKMILLHDLAESEIGDYTPEQISAEKKKEIENKAFLKILENLPSSIKSQYLEIWQEYQKQDSFEAKIVDQLDRLEMALQAKIYQDEGYSKEKLQTFFNTAKKEIIHPKLKEIFRNIVEDV